MFTGAGLNVARQPDNGADPRPDNRDGWLAGDTPDVVEAFLDTADEARAAGIEVRLWNPSTQLRFARKPKVPPRPDGAANTWPPQAA
jgi:biotin synthase